MRRSLLIFFAAFGARLFFVLYGPFWAGDSADYHRIAEHLIEGSGYAIYPASPTAYRSPGYPVFLAFVYAIAGPQPEVVLLLQAALGGATFWALYFIARRSLGEDAAFVGALLAGVYPHLAFYAGALLTETLSLLLLAAGLLAMNALRPGRAHPLLAVTAGALLGAAALTSPRLAGMPLAFVAVAWARGFSRRDALRGLALMAFGYAAVLSPWVARNAATFGTFVPYNLGHQGPVFWITTTSAGLYDYRYRELAKTEPLMARYVDLYLDHPDEEFARFSERRALEADFTRDALSRIARDPLGYAAGRTRAYPALWVQPAAYAGHFRSPFESQNAGLDQMLASRQWLPAAARLGSIAVFTVGLFAGAAIGAWTLRHRWRELTLLAFPIAYTALSQLPFVVEERYSVLAHPFLWLLSATSLLALRARLRDAISLARRFPATRDPARPQPEGPPPRAKPK